MNFTVAEIELLRLAGRCKSLPLELSVFDFTMLSPTGIKSLFDYRLVNTVKKNGHIRLTATGWDLLILLGYDYPQDAKYITDTMKLARRNSVAQIVFTFYRAGMNVFTDTTDSLINTSIFVSSASARRNKESISRKVWAGCRLSGIAKIKDTAYMVHFTDDMGMYFTAEMELFHKLTANKCINTACIYAASSYKEAVHWITTDPVIETKKRLNALLSFRKTFDSTKLSLHLLECSNTGAIQLQIMAIKDWRSQVVKLALGENYCPPQDSTNTDAIWNNNPLITALDMDVKRVMKAYQQAMDIDKKLLILAFPSQLDALAEFLSFPKNIELYSIEEKSVIDALELCLFEPSHEPYRTQKGALLYASDIPTRRKAGRPSGKEI